MFFIISVNSRDGEFMYNVTSAFGFVRKADSTLQA